MKKDYLIIDRAKWRTGGNPILNPNYTGEGSTHLLNDQGYMCCLGFRCEQMGIPEQHLLNVGMPSGLYNLYDIPDLINESGKNSEFAVQAVRINDDPSLSTKEREKAITEHFKKIGVIVEFKGRYKKS